MSENLRPQPTHTHQNKPIVFKQRQRRPSSNKGSTVLKTKPIRIRKRGGTLQEVSFDKILWRLRTLSDGLDVDYTRVAQDGITGLVDKMKSSDIDRLTANLAHLRHSEHPDYDILASRIIISNHHKETVGFELFSQAVWELYEAGLINEKFYDVVQEYASELDDAIDYDRDYYLTYFGFKTFERSYGMRVDDKVIERPQHMFMRVAVAIWMDDIERAIETYEWLSSKYFTHASPTNFNAGSVVQQLSSCFLVAMKEDSIKGIFDTLSQCAYISKTGGGLGMHCSNIRSTGEIIKSCGRGSVGLIPMLKGYEWMTQYADQGRRRPGAIACFVEDTEVVTVNKGVKKIQDIELGDLVVTHMNRIKPVTQIHKNPLGDRKIYKLIVERNKEIYVTGNHKFWSFHTKKYKDKQISLGWNSVEELKNLVDNPETTRQTCYIAIPSGTGIEKLESIIIDVKDYQHILEDETHNLKSVETDKIIRLTRSMKQNGVKDISTSQSINRKWTITPDLANLFGIWLGNGHVKKDKVKNIIRGIGITVHDKNQEEINFIKNVFNNTFGCNIAKVSSKRSNNCVNIMVNSSIVGMIFNELFGSHFDGKFLPEMVFGWPKTLVNCLLGGLITSDGHITKTKCNATLGLSNQTLLNQLYHLCRMNGLAVSFVKGEKGKGMTRDPYSMSIPLNTNLIKQIRKFYEDDRMKRCKKKAEDDKYVKKTCLKILDIIETERKDEYVYTFGVEDDHSYMVEGLLAENCYLEPWHPDIFDFLDLKKNTGPEERRARDLHTAMWIPDLFMERVKEDGMWSLMPVVGCPGLQEAYGDDFKELYMKYEKEEKFVRQVKAQELYNAIIISQLETGEPYMVYKDHVNRKSNQKNLGTIKSSNLCAEIVLYSDEEETAVCNLCSIALPSYIRYDDENKPYYDFETLSYVVRIATRNLNRLIDRNFYPTPETKKSNMRNRPIGIGIQGLADTYIRMRYPYDSPEAAKLNKEIFETMYYAALTESCEIAKTEGHYPSYPGSPISKGKFQFDLWMECGHEVELSGKWDWEKLRRRIKEFGIRNSMLLAVMPTASTSQFLGFNESFEAYTSNMYSRRTNSGSFKVINKQLIYDLIELGLWNDRTKQRILYYDGSIQQMTEIPKNIRDLYKTSWDLSQKVIIQQSADRGPFIDHTQSLNIHIEQPSISTMSSLHMYAWEKGLKTGMYYLRRKPAKRAIQSTIDIEIENEIENDQKLTLEDLLPKNRKKDELNISTDESVAPASPPTSDMEIEGWICLNEEGCTSCGA